MKYKIVALIALAVILLVHWISSKNTAAKNVQKITDNPNKNIQFDKSKLKDIWVAGGCFWGIQAYVEKIPGVYNVTVGYANSDKKNPRYQEVCSGSTYAVEAAHVQYDPEKTTLENLLIAFFKVVDPTVKNRQGNDIGTQYKTGIYYKEVNDKKIIDKVIKLQEDKFKTMIYTEVQPLENYYLAEEYHQDYLQKNPNGYCHIDFSELDEITSIIDPKDYPRPTDKELKNRLTDIQYNVALKDDTERAFLNEYVDNHETGLYVDIATGEPLFSSQDKYDSKSGWPSFTKPIIPEVVVLKKDFNLFINRIEVRSRSADIHLGHVFDDGPKDKGGKRYCINSASLKFIPLDKMKENGYEDLIDYAK